MDADLDYEYRAYIIPSDPIETFDQRKQQAFRDLQERFGIGWEPYKTYPGTIFALHESADGVTLLFRQPKRRGAV